MITAAKIQKLATQVGITVGTITQPNYNENTDGQVDLEAGWYVQFNELENYACINFSANNMHKMGPEINTLKQLKISLQNLKGLVL